MDTLEELFGACDFVSIHVPLVDETRGMVGHKALAKSGLILINMVRGGIVDEGYPWILLRTELWQGLASMSSKRRFPQYGIPAPP